MAVDQHHLPEFRPHLLDQPGKRPIYAEAAGHAGRLIAEAGLTLVYGGGKVGLHVLAASGGEGHWLAETEAGVKIAAPELERALKPTAAKKR